MRGATLLCFSVLPEKERTAQAHTTRLVIVDEEDIYDEFSN